MTFKPDKCWHCDKVGELVPVTSHVKTDSGTILVPAYECQSCGKETHTPDSFRTFEEVTKTIQEQASA
jgi:hypothetical protein